MSHHLYLRQHEDGDVALDGFIVFDGHHVNLHRMAALFGLNYSYLWKIFRGDRVPSMAYAKQIGAALQYPSTLEFLAALESHLASQPQSVV